jgi:DnaK suppressor protein
MNKKDSQRFKDLLIVLKARIRGDVEQLTDEALAGHDGASGQNSPTHIAELGTDAYEQDFALRFVENDQEVLDEIEAALERIEEGTYGICESCREAGRAPSKSQIPKTRLKAIPYARNCIECERKREELSI